ncbi:uncharacterized protein FIBRA_01106 [Fibroporia radiculosa]|uniref:Mmc1 C-terminal domain-containing protein n=1 Tax=Fibroporia radiculosa TaxID=599839 RepID=J4HSS1_9APHY|nr:uncharacterized protein FIBRA_01106 [Fibroporia radiculosa]CCL99092.1 predicted protein [Fibroporia radiculosa]
MSCASLTAVFGWPSRVQRAASTAVAQKQAPSTSSSAGDRSHLLTVLHKTRSFLPRVLPPRQNESSGVDTLEFWEDLLATTYDDLCPTPEARETDRIRVAIYGCDSSAETRALVAALLQEPFASESQRESVDTRWKHTSDGQGFITIQQLVIRRYGTPKYDGSSSPRIQSAWLQQFGAPLQLVELEPASRPPTEELILRLLLTADIPIIVCNPALAPLSSLLSASGHSLLPLNHPNAVLALNATTESTQLVERVQSLCGIDIPVLCIDPLRALNALNILNSSPSSPLIVQRFQDNFDASGVSKLTENVASAISNALQVYPSATAVEALHMETAHSIILHSLAKCRKVLDDARAETDAVCTEISSLRGRMEEVKATAGKDVLGVEGNEVAKDIEQSRRNIRTVMDALVWWKLLWRVDDVAGTVTAAVDQVWCKDLDYQLAFHAGRLYSLQQSFHASSERLLKSFSPRSPFNSPVLRNTISQVSSAPAFSMDVSSFAAPIRARRRQFHFPTTRLQTAARHTLLAVSGSSFGGMAIAWAGWAGQLGILDMAISMDTATGLGMLSTAVGVKWAIDHFERAKRKWWKDYDRVGQGLRRDLKDLLTRTIDDRVLLIPEKTCAGLEHTIMKQKAQINDLRTEVAILEEELNKFPPR